MLEFKDINEEVTSKDTFTNIFNVCDYLLFEKPSQHFKLGL